MYAKTKPTDLFVYLSAGLLFVYCDAYIVLLLLLLLHPVLFPYEKPFDTESQLPISSHRHNSTVFCGRTDGRMNCILRIVYRRRRGRRSWPRREGFLRPVTYSPTARNECVFEGKRRRRRRGFRLGPSFRREKQSSARRDLRLSFFLRTRAQFLSPRITKRRVCSVYTRI